MVVRASEVAVKEESGTPSLGLEVVETLEPICRVQLKVRVPASVCKDCYDQVLKEFGKQARMRSFIIRECTNCNLRFLLINCMVRRFQVSDPRRLCQNPC